MRSKDVRLFGSCKPTKKYTPPPPKTPVGAITTERKNHAANNKALTHPNFVYWEVFNYLRRHRRTEFEAPLLFSGTRVISLPLKEKTHRINQNLYGERKLRI